jgi:hypothetical protein
MSFSTGGPGSPGFPLGSKDTTGFNLGGTYDFDQNHHLLFSAGRALQNASNQRLLLLLGIAMDVLTRPRGGNACAAAIAADVGRRTAACRIASVGDSSPVESASTKLFDSRGNALCQRRTRRGPL